MKLALVIGFLGALATPALAASCPTGNADVAHCDQMTLHDIGAEPAIEWNPQDEKMVAYRPAHPAAQPRLVIIMHGHPGPAPTSFSRFQSVAASQGLFSITLDADFNGNGANSPSDTCAANKNANATCSNAAEEVCGCFAGCFGAFDALINGGFVDVGLPDPITVNVSTLATRYLPVKTRLKSYLSWLAAQPGGSAWGQFLTTGGDLQWPKIVGAGVSRGSSLIGELARNNPMERVLMFSGPGEHTGGTDATDEAGAGTRPTTYSWGAAHNFNNCTMQAGSPTWVSDNAFFGNSGTTWATTNLWSLDDSRDPRWVRTYANGTTDGTFRNLVTLGLGKRHNASAHDGILVIGTFDDPNLSFKGHQGLVSNEMCANTSSDGGHLATLADGCTDDASNSYRTAIWTYMLTH